MTYLTFFVGLYSGGVLLGMVFGLVVSEDKPDLFTDRRELAALGLVTLAWPWLAAVVVVDAVATSWRRR